MSNNCPDQDGKDLVVSAYVKLIRTAESLHAEVSRGLLVEGLTASQFSTLKVLRLHGPLAQRDIAKFLLKTGGNVTIVVDNLERQGLVKRTRDVEDRRFVYVDLTPDGNQLFDKLYRPHLDRIRNAMGGISAGQVDLLIQLLEALSPTAEEPACADPSAVVRESTAI